MPERHRPHAFVPPPAELAVGEDGGRTQPRPLILALVGGLVATLVLVFLAGRLEERAARADFAALAQQRFTLIDAGIERALDSLVAIGGFHDSQAELSRQQFGDVARPLLRRQPALRALEWVPYTSGDRLAALRAAVRADGYPAFDFSELAADGSLHALGPRAEYFPVCYIEPMRGNERAFGLDLGSDPERYQALDAARREGGLVATARLILVQERSREYGVLIFRPVYRHAMRTGRADPPTEGAILVPEPAALRGYVLAVVRVAALPGVAAADWHGAPMDILLFDQSASTGEQLLFPIDAKATSIRDATGTVGVQHLIRMGGRNWTVVAQPAGGQLRVDHTATRILLVAGLLLTGLLALLQEQGRSRARMVESRVSARTADLLESERRLIQANYEAVQGSRLKTMFLASMSHEFRTPMNAILGLLHVLGRTPLDAVQRDHVDKIASAARRLLRLIDDILDVSRIEAGKLSVERQPFALESVLRDMLVAVAPKLRDKPVELVLDLDPALPAELVGDAMRLTQVLVNLADNAAKFTPEGEVLVSIESSPVADRRIELRVSVRDTGPGLSEQEAQAVFQPYVQAASPRQRHPGGTGLGLAICRQLVNLMGGEIGVETQLGAGARFHFTVPLGVAAATRLAAERPSEPAPRVLVLDPHPAAGDALARLARGFGCAARSATGAAEAGALLAAHEFDLLLCSESFAPGALLSELPAGRALPHTVMLGATGASLRGDVEPELLEKPVLPAALAQVLFRPQPQARPGRPVVRAPEAIRVAAEPRRAIQPPAVGEVPAELRALVDPLRQLLEQGDPAAELAARALLDWARETPYARVAADLLRDCSNFDFREALERIDTLCPLTSRQER